MRSLITTLTIATLTTGCGFNKYAHLYESQGSGGGQDTVTVDMPFAYGYQSLCTQGAGGEYSHSYSTTLYDIDLDTPNDAEDLIYAPRGGTVYVHDDGDDNFGKHINIDLHDGTYLVLAHLDDSFVTDGEEVAAGQLIGMEGSSGASTGDHLHMGRHLGEATESAVYGDSVEGLKINAYNVDLVQQDGWFTIDWQCDLYAGHTYESRLETPLWHPNGTLVKTPGDVTVYLVQDGATHPFDDQETFWSYNYSFQEVVLIDDGELDCYEVGEEISRHHQVRALYHDGQVWLLMHDTSSANRSRSLVRSTGWQGVLKSWGITASTYDDLSTSQDLFEDYPDSGEYVTFRDGTLITEVGDSAVYAIADGVAMPIDDWDTYLLMGLWDRTVIEVDDGVVQEVQGRVGDCGTDTYCITAEDVTTCASGGTYDAAGYDEEDEVDDEEEQEEEEQEQEEDVVEEEQEQEDDDIEAEEDGCDDGIPDDLGECRDWVRTDGNKIGLNVDLTFTSSVDGTQVAATGYNLVGDWSYDDNYVVDYDSSTDFGWYALSDGLYRMTMRSDSQWAIYWQYCEDSTNTSSLCYENNDETYALCLEVAGGTIMPLATNICRTME